MSLTSRYWPARLAEWGPVRPEPQPGYSLILPIPGDLPVFLELALDVCHQQGHAHRVETIVIPDQLTPEVTDIVDSRRREWPGPLTIAEFPRFERAVLPRLNNPFRNYGMQFVTGVRSATGSHVLMHDADLFMVDDGFHEATYARAVQGDLAVAGVSPVWDEWYQERGTEIVATWEICVRRDWARSFPPFMHMGHEGELYGERHVFDVTLLPQALTDTRLIGIPLGDADIVHFNHVIGTYRAFCRHRGEFLDNEFRLLLIAVFIALFAQRPFTYASPPLAELAESLSAVTTRRVDYPDPLSGSMTYAAFRRKLERFLALTWITDQRRGEVRSALSVFDTYYGFVSG